jgi:hypothetical protein
LSEVLLVSLGGDAVDGVSDLEFGFAEEGGVGGGDQGARHLKQLFLGGQRQGGGKFLSLGFLFGRKGLFHRSFSDTEGAFLAETSFSRLVYKDSTNFRDAYTFLAFRIEQETRRLYPHRQVLQTVPWSLAS